ncbi:excisionase [Tardiphaga sp. OK246]|uniref:excisionase n=1 Tax=Tardiphaga sp. OK246 TaxID=1855307 RepID=UPI001FCDF369|nr:excisionase [Tardiphaga sp. OK246]
MNRRELGDPKVDRDSPLRLKAAAALAFPDGSMTASGLRREAMRGRLVIERIAGKDYTTLENIKLMREKCRVEAKDRACGGARSAVKAGSSFNKVHGSSSTKESISPRDALLAKISKRNNS